MRLIRWLLVMPLALGSVYAAVLVGVVLLRLSDRLCGALAFSEAHCTIAWYPVAETVVASLCAAVALLLAVHLPAFVAPSSKRAVAIAGALISLPLVIWVLVVLAFPLFLPAVCSLLAGLLAIRGVSHRHAGAT